MIDFPLTNPVLVFATVMLIVLLVPPLFRKLRLPGLVGLIVSGAVVGPHALGLLERGDTFELLGTVGLLYLMFTAGLSLDLNQFIQYKSRSLVFGGLSYLFPAAGAYIVGTQVLGFAPPAAVLLGAIVGSHTLLAYPVAARLGLTKNAAVTMAMGGTMVTDIVSLLVLAAVSATLSGDTGPVFWASFVGLVVVYGTIVFVGVPRLGQWFFRTVRNQADLEFVFLLAVVFVVAYLAELAYLAPIIGAFLVGIALNPLVPERSALMLRIEFVGEALFIPFFLISVGMLVDTGMLLEDWTVGLYTLSFAGLVWVGKGCASGAVGWLYGLSASEIGTVFGLSTPQAAATLAVTLVGFEMELFGEAVVNAVVLLILLTAVVGPWAVERFGRQVARAEAAAPYRPPEGHQRILVPLSHAETVGDLIDLALLMRSEGSQEPLYPLTVVRDGTNEEVEARVAAGERLLEHAVRDAMEAEVPAVPLIRVDYNVADGMVRAVTEERISTIVVGWSGDSSARSVVFGSVLDQLLADTEDMIIVGRTMGRIATNERLLLAVPPYADREVGFPGMAQAFKSLAQHAGLTLVLVATEDTLRTLTPRMDQTPPTMDIETWPLHAWADLVGTLDEQATPSDIVALVSEREGSVAWRPSLRRLPGVLTRRFEENTVLTVYMGEAPLPRPSAARSYEPVESLAPFLRPEHMVVELEGEGKDAIEHLLRQPDLLSEDAFLVEALCTTPEYAPELRPGVALYSTHTDRVKATHLLVGTRTSGLRLPDASRPVHLVFVLVGGRAMGSEAYVQLLSEITRLAQSEPLLDAVRDCTDADELQQVVMGHLHRTNGNGPVAAGAHGG
ncbi:MAG: cation:proton antiporter [Salinibacter sp.]